MCVYPYIKDKSGKEKKMKCQSVSCVFTVAFTYSGR
jgi:hypothetical protein